MTFLQEGDLKRQGAAQKQPLSVINQERKPQEELPSLIKEKIVEEEEKKQQPSLEKSISQEREVIVVIESDSEDEASQKSRD